MLGRKLLLTLVNRYLDGKPINIKLLVDITQSWHKKLADSRQKTVIKVVRKYAVGAKRPACVQFL